MKKVNYNKDSLTKKYEESFRTKDKGQFVSKQTIDWTKVAEEKGREIQFFQVKEGWNKIIIVPYIIQSKNHPGVARKKFEIGDLDYNLDYFVHRMVGLNRDDVVCLKSNYGMNCPICQISDKMREDGNKDEYQRLKPTRRVLYNIIDMNNIDAGLQVFDVSYFLFEKELISASRSFNEDGTIVNFADPIEGAVIKFRAEKEKFGVNGKDYFVYKNFSFMQRNESLPDELIEQAISFDKYLEIYSSDEIIDILDGVKEEEVEVKERIDKEEPKKLNLSSKEEKTDKSSLLSSLASKISKSNVNKFEESEEIEEQQQDKKEEKVVSEVNKESKDCPYGHGFGVDCDSYDDCDKCKLWKDCSLDL